MSTTTENLERNHRARWNIASSTWFLFMIGSWIALGAVAVSNSHMLTDFWRWGQRLPLVAEIGLWIGTLPWMLAIAVLETVLDRMASDRAHRWPSRLVGSLFDPTVDPGSSSSAELELRICAQKRDPAVR